MKIAVLGTGSVGRTMAARFAALGHDVTIGTRDLQATLARSEPDAMGNPPFSAWAADHSRVPLVTFADAAEQAELVVNATNGGVSIEVLTQAGADNLAGKVLLDIANPLDFSQGFPPTLFVKDTDSLGEQIQRAFPDVKVVKTLNTMTAALMAEPVLAADGDHSVFVSGERRGRQGDGDRAPAGTRPHRRDRPRRPQHRPRHGDAAADLVAADGRPGYADVQLQDRPLTVDRRT